MKNHVGPKKDFKRFQKISKDFKYLIEIGFVKDYSWLYFFSSNEDDYISINGSLFQRNYLKKN